MKSLDYSLLKVHYVNVKYTRGRTMLDLAMDKLTFDEVTIPESSSVTLLGVVKSCRSTAPSQQLIETSIDG